MKRGFLGHSRKEPADLCTICKSTREESIDTLQAASIDNVHQKSIDNVHHQSIDKLQAAVIDSANKPPNNTIHRGIIHLGTVHHTTIHPCTVYRTTVHRDTIHHDTVHLPSVDTIHPMSVETIHPASIDTVHPASINTVHPDTVHRDTVHPDTVHPVKNDTTCGEIEKIEGDVIPDVIDVAEMNDFDLSREWYDGVGQDPFQGLPHQDPRKHIEELEDLVSRNDTPGHTGLPYHHVQVSRPQPCLAAQYRSMFGLEFRSMSNERCRSTEVCLRSTVVSECRSTKMVYGSTVVDENRDELLLLSIDEERLPLWIEHSKLAGSDENSS
ncbi:hypothetical protein F2Q70_00038446 [Brassica cretica]|uniref:Uncharacterized protein n=1 Tax=Brassica cretica TaxID=69181 RepID=A0A8S9K3X2_BRACR|nr:hypothetical protein F2Q70_00038446 [Brassica cretica]